VMLPKWPDRIVTEPFPHSVMASTLGPALKFWNGCALTAWFLCEGPYSRTDMEGLAGYHAKELTRLEQLGTPVDPKLFADLIKAQAKLGPPTPIESTRSSQNVGHGMSVTFSTHMGMRRSGFTQLRDIITKYRGAWAQQHLPQYLRALWESEIQEAERAYNLLLNQKGKPPTARACRQIHKDIEMAATYTKAK
ncbi:MAG: hypothetical protein U1D69_12885, partial [Polynucleobacter sp.]|nr:hypothetical protein [Polynucleobacter sp.]